MELVSFVAGIKLIQTIKKPVLFPIVNQMKRSHMMVYVKLVKNILYYLKIELPANSLYVHFIRK